MAKGEKPHCNLSAHLSKLCPVASLSFRLGVCPPLSAKDAPRPPCQLSRPDFKKSPGSLAAALCLASSSNDLCIVHAQKTKPS